MSVGNWLLEGGRVYRLAETYETEVAAKQFAEVLAENCVVLVSKTKNGMWGVYWRPKVGNLCPYGVV